jgi:hypothetical protein
MGRQSLCPRNTVHAWVNLGPGPARLLFTFVPGGIDEFYPQISRMPPDGWTDLGCQYTVDRRSAFGHQVRDRTNRLMAGGTQ